MGVMWHFVISRLLLGLITLILVSMMMMVGVELLPGDAAQALLGQTATPETVEALRRELGLDQPVVMRYFSWLVHAVSGDLGHSLSSGLPVANLLASKLWNSLMLAGAAAIIVIPSAVLFGIIAAYYSGGALVALLSAATLVMLSVPSFLLGYLLIYIFSTRLGWLPAIAILPQNGSVILWLNATLLPIATLYLAGTAHMMRLTRASLLSIMASDYIQMAEIKGLSRWRIVTRHAFPNAVSPILSIAMLTFAYMVVGSVVVEAVFNYPGMGKLMVDAVSFRDVPLMQACGLIYCSLFVVLNFLADLLALYFNPRLQASEHSHG